MRLGFEEDRRLFRALSVGVFSHQLLALTLHRSPFVARFLGLIVHYNDPRTETQLL